MSHEAARLDVRRRLEQRDDSFLDVFERGVVAVPESPYRRLLEHAGVEPHDVRALVRGEGLERALERLHDAGVYVTLDEFNGRRPIRRGSLELHVEASDFDNPLGRKHYRTQTGGSSGTARSVLVDLGMTEHEARYLALVDDAFDVGERPFAIWFPVPPGVAGTKAVLVRAKLGSAYERWFTPTRLRASGRSTALTMTTMLVGRTAGFGFRLPEYLPLDDPRPLVEWLAAARRRGTPPLICCTPSSGVRIGLAARELGADIAGTVFWFGGEPYTAGKAEVVAAAGCRAFSNYYFTEIGQLGLACAEPDAVDDVHLAMDTVAAIERPPKVASGLVADALHYTSLLPVSPKLALNVESGDYGVLRERRCNCALDEVGYRRHLHTIRSYEKLVTEGMNFLGSDLTTLVEDVLPARFGGSATQYQFVEDEREGVTRVSLSISPGVGPVDEQEVARTVLAALAGESPPLSMMAEVWRAAGTLEIARVEPAGTAASKVLPLHVVRSPAA
ncbi:MAG: hypothetical protein QOF50_105 [Gaiellaceae bacterium]|nr:hypothetical protein [Gaiellaceae bacterium]